MVRKELELRNAAEVARAQATAATTQCEQLRAELSAVQGRFATASRRATEVANAAPRPLPPSLAAAKTPPQARPDEKQRESHRLLTALLKYGLVPAALSVGSRGETALQRDSRERHTERRRERSY